MIEPKEIKPKEIEPKEIEPKKIPIKEIGLPERQQGILEQTQKIEEKPPVIIEKKAIAADHKKMILNHCRVIFAKLSPFFTTVFFCLLVIYYELVFHAYNFKLNDGNIGYILLFSVGIGAFVSVFTNFFSSKMNRVISIIFTCLLAIIFIAQLIYHEVFQNYLSITGTIQYGNQAADNYATVLRNMKENWWMLLLILLPVVVVCIFFRKIGGFQRRKWWQSLCLFLGVVIFYVSGIQIMKLQRGELYSAYQIYKQYTSVDMAVEKLGVCEAFVVDLRDGIATAFGKKKNIIEFQTVSKQERIEDSEAEEEVEDIALSDDVVVDGTEEEIREQPEEVIIDTSPNVLEIDFEAVNQAADNEGIEALSTYFQSLEPTNKNQYTGMFEGYNLIWITAEAFSGYVLETDLFPTLSMMANEGFVFQNYYSPLWYGSTLGGEYANLLGSMPRNGGYLSLSYAARNGNALPFSMGNQLNSLGYTTIAYHDNSSTYYDRNISHPALGYEWIANGTGLAEQKNESGGTLWPQSDLTMVQETFDDYADKTPFHIYYLTVSGHVEYNFGGNAMSAKNQEVVAELPYGETTRAYIAAQYELELALEELVNDLKENGLYDNTVIVLAGDHVPYDNMEVLDELAGRELEDNFEAYKSTLIIWSGAMEEPVQVKKVCSSIDILPTVSNLFGLEYDSRLLIGQDILSDSQGLVMFNNRSYITDHFSYNAVNEDVNSLDGHRVTDEEVAEMSAFVANKFTAAEGITEYDYYRYIENFLSTQP